MTMPPTGPWGPPHQPSYTPPPKGPRGGSGVAKILLLSLAVLAIVVVTIVATLAVSRDDPPQTASPSSTGAASSSSEAPADVASADDTGPATVITEEPTCAAWGPIAQRLADAQGQGWTQRDSSIPADAWSPEQRRSYQLVSTAVSSAADETAPLARATPHRVMREIYEQTIAYWRSYADAIPNYSPADDHFATAAGGLASTVTWICEAIDYGSAPARSKLITEGVTPEAIAPIGDITDPERFIGSNSPICEPWHSMVTDYRAATAQWRSDVDPALPASQWSPAQQSSFTSMITVMSENGSTIQQLGVRSNNPVWYDFAALIGNYRDAYIQAIPTYMPADNYLDSVASELTIAIDEACRVEGG